MTPRAALRLAVLAAACLMAGGCALTPIDAPNPTEMRRGEPGLFSGPDGEFVIFQGAI